MAGWKKHFQTYNTTGSQSPLSGSKSRDKDSASRFQSWLPEVYVGQPNRLQRYMQYDQMDMDSEINTALNTIAEFSTQQDEETETPFIIKWHDTPVETESEVLLTVLKQWCRINEWNRRMFKTMRNAIKYGDQPFIRDPETWKLFYVNPGDVMRVIVDEAQGKDPAQYIIKNIQPNFQKLTATGQANGNNYAGAAVSPTQMNHSNIGRTSGQVSGASGLGAETEFLIDASHVIHIALTDGMDASWPFGNSVLDAVFKTYKQKELLEDSIIIYRVQRAPERRIFYIDVGDMPAHQAMSHVERVKNEIHQRRIPSRTGGGSNMMDAQYNPLSIMEDYFFAQCLSLDTRLSMLDGRTLTLQEVIDEYEQGKENYVYGLSDKTFEMEPAKIKWAGITRRNAKVMRITLDNGESVTATPDHKFILRDGSEVEAQYLNIGDSLMPLTLVDGYSGPKQKNKKYTRYVSNADGKTKFVHAVVSNKPIGKDIQVHHIDFDSKNNNPCNLEVMKTEDHIQLHKDIGTYSLNKQWNSDIGREKLIEGMRKLYDNRTLEFDHRLSERNRKNISSFWNNKDKIRQQQSSIASLKKIQKEVSDARRINFTIDMTNAMIECFNQGNSSISKLRTALSNYEPFKNAYKESNSSRKVSKSESEMISVTDTTLNKLVQVIGYNTFGDWKVDYTGVSKFSNKTVERQNHKIVDIEMLEERINTGDITIESDSDSHWFGLSAGIYVHNSAEGRGSKVDTLPGGQNLGDIDDLKFFNNKLARGLGIPSSYLPTGPDDGTATYNDGRVGTSFIQEYRFTQYCQRLQNMIQQVMDKEFKMFLKHRGYEIDSSQFELDFVEPQSFSDYREIEINAARTNVFGAIEGVDYISKRFALKKYLQLSDSEILENEKLWKQENPIKGDKGAAVDTDEFSDLGGVGVQGGADGSLDDFESDEEFDDAEMDDIDDDGASPLSGDEGEDEL